MPSALKIEAQVGLTGLLAAPSEDSSFAELPANLQAASKYFGGDPRSYATGRAELDHFDAAAADAALVDWSGRAAGGGHHRGQAEKTFESGGIGGRRGLPEDFLELHAQYAGLSSRSRQVIPPDAGHMSLVYDKSNAADVV